MISFLGKLLFLFWQIVLVGAPLREEREPVLSLQQLPPAHKKQPVFRLAAPGRMLIFEAGQVVEKDSQCEYNFGGRFVLMVTAPISLRPSDVISVDSATGKVEIIEREGIVIWRAAWVN